MPIIHITENAAPWCGANGPSAMSSDVAKIRFECLQDLLACNFKIFMDAV